MANAPYYKVIVVQNQRDITDKISRLSYEDATDVDNLLTLHINTNSVEDLDDEDIKSGGFITTRNTNAGKKSVNFVQYLDDAALKEGAILQVQFGYRLGAFSVPFLMRVSNHRPTYGDNINLIVEATDLGILMKKDQSKKIWQNVSSSAIVKTISQNYGLTAVVNDTSKVHAFMPQGGRTDYDFLKYLSTLEQAGSFHFFLRGNEVHFERIPIDKAAFRLYTYATHDGNILNFQPNSLEMLKKGASRNTVVTSVDPFTNQPVQKVVNTPADDPKLGDYLVAFNENAIEQPLLNKKPSAILSNKNDPNRAGEHMHVPIDDETDAGLDGNSYNENIGSQVKKGAALKDYEGTLTAEGDPDVLANCIVTLAAVSKRDTGNWYVKRSNHDLTSDGGYITRLTLNKNAAEVKISKDAVKQTAVNKTVGTKDEAKKELPNVYFDENANVVKQPN